MGDYIESQSIAPSIVFIFSYINIVGDLATLELLKNYCAEMSKMTKMLLPGLLESRGFPQNKSRQTLTLYVKVRLNCCFSMHC